MNSHKLAICVLLGALIVLAEAAFADDKGVIQTGNLANQGYPLTVNSNVADSASIEAVLIPTKIATRIFGRETAKNYLVIELLVANHNPQASLIIESLFLDYSQWLPAQADHSGNCVNGKPTLEDTGPAQRTNCPKQIASTEYRLVRAELLEQQPFTKRNLIINGATALGSIGTAFAFPFSRDVVSGINAWNGGVVPAMSSFIPDSTIGQLNHISDLGFQTNKVIPKQSSDVIVAFFPIDRLFSFSLKRIYFSDPAIFFVPGELELEPKFSKYISKLVQASYPDFHPSNYMQLHSACRQLEAMNKEMLAAGYTAKPDDTTTHKSLDMSCQVSNFLNSIALTSIHVGIGGDMSVNVQLVPPTITGVDWPGFNQGDTNSIATFWNTKGKKPDGSILGTFLAGSMPEIVDSQGKSIPGLTIKAIATGAADNDLPVSLSLDACLPPATKDIYLRVSKKSSAGDSADAKNSQSNQVSSMLYDLGAYPGPLAGSSCPGAPAKDDNKKAEDKKADH